MRNRRFATVSLLLLSFVTNFLPVIAAPGTVAPSFEKLHGDPATKPDWGVPFRTVAIDGYLAIAETYNTFPDEWEHLRQTSEKSIRCFDPSRFCFLVHAGSSPKKLEILRRDPRWLRRVLTFSASLIDQDHRATYGRYGVIVSAPAENILAAKSSDMGTPFSKMFQPAQQADLELDPTYPFLISMNLPATPASILAKTDPRSHSEIVVAGTTPSGKSVRIIGLFIKTKNGARTISEAEEAEIVRLAGLLKVPVLRIEAPSTRDF